MGISYGGEMLICVMLSHVFLYLNVGCTYLWDVTIRFP